MELTAMATKRMPHKAAVLKKDRFILSSQFLIRERCLWSQEGGTGTAKALREGLTCRTGETVNSGSSEYEYFGLHGSEIQARNRAD